MKARIVPVEESADISIPRPLLEVSELKGEVEVEAQKGYLVIRAAKSARQGWEAAFSRMAEAATTNSFSTRLRRFPAGTRRNGSGDRKI
jgi:antitoxin MazE